MNRTALQLVKTDIGQLSRPAEEMCQRVPLAWNGSETAIPRKTVHELFEEQAGRTPEAIAAEHESERLSYAELNRRANQIGHCLRRIGIGNESRVGILLDRGLDMLVATLGVLKAGGAYVPLNVDYPIERLQWMSENAQLQAVLGSGSRLQEIWGRKQDVQVVDLGERRREIQNQSCQKIGVPLDPQNLAYLMYTSGSTGVPKGVGVPHRAITRLVMNTDYVELGERHVMLQYAPTSFDAATFEIWGSLLRGGRLVIAPAGHLTVNELGELIEQRGVSTLWLTASLFQAAIEGVSERLRGVHQLLAGGEALSPRTVRKAAESLPGCALINGYGPTENTTFSCCWQVVAEEIDSTVPIGKPIANTQAYVLDGDMAPVPAGAVGELYVGGLGLARGYWGCRDLTAETFLPNPFSTRPGERLYRTGDLVKWRECGDLDFLGRRDQQVKLRGYRIELEEIETNLLAHSAVKQALVVMREDNGGEKHLVAYVLMNPGSAHISKADLRRHLQQRLPEYMVPWRYIMLEAMPLTPNGKLDRRALPAPNPSGLDGDYVAPRTATEVIVSKVWGTALGVEKPGVHDLFFELGGHSLLAMQVISRLRLTCEIDLPAWQIFQTPTIVTLSEAIDTAKSVGGHLIGGKVPRISRNSRIPASSAQQRLWFLYQLAQDTATYNIPICFRGRGTLLVSALEQSISELQRRHEILRTTFTPDAEGLVQIIRPANGLSLRLVDLSEVEVGNLDRVWKTVAKNEAERTFNLQSGPLMRAALVRLEGDEFAVILTMHHIVFDGWSLDVLNEELTELYRSFAAGAVATLSELEVQCGDLAVWEQNRLQGDLIESGLDYWRHQLADLVPLELPTDRPAPPVPTSRGGTVSVEIPTH